MIQCLSDLQLAELRAVSSAYLDERQLQYLPPRTCPIPPPDCLMQAPRRRNYAFASCIVAHTTTCACNCKPRIHMLLLDIRPLTLERPRSWRRITQASVQGKGELTEAETATGAWGALTIREALLTNMGGDVLSSKTKAMKLQRQRINMLAEKNVVAIRR